MRFLYMLVGLLPTVLACNNPAFDACASAFTKSSSSAVPFCTSYTKSHHILPTGLPAYAAYCFYSPVLVSSACSCLVTTTTTTTSKTTTSTTPVATTTSSSTTPSTTTTSRTTTSPSTTTSSSKTTSSSTTTTSSITTTSSTTTSRSTTTSTSTTTTSRSTTSSSTTSPSTTSPSTTSPSTTSSSTTSPSTTSSSTTSRSTTSSSTTSRSTTSSSTTSRSTTSSSTTTKSSTSQSSQSSTSSSSTSKQPTATISPDNTCGGTNGYTCPSNLYCCSQYGWCGTTVAYCGTGCQPLFGLCGNVTTSSGPAQATSTGSVVNVPRPLIGSVPYGKVITDCVNDGDIALTYDDGPYIYTSDLLDLLAKYGVKATFFIIGNKDGNGQIDQTPAWTSVIQRMDSEGHQVASHTWTHPDLTTLTSGQRLDEMYQNEQAFSNILGKFPTYMRPPYLSFDDACGLDMIQLGYHVIFCNLDTKDYENDDPNLIQTSKDWFNGNISSTTPSTGEFLVLEHDIHYQTVYNLTEYEINRIQAEGYRPVTVGECLGDPAANWYRAAPASSSKVRAREVMREDTEFVEGTKFLKDRRRYSV